MSNQLDTMLRNQQALMLALARLLEIATGGPTTDASVHVENLYRLAREGDAKEKQA